MNLQLISNSIPLPSLSEIRISEEAVNQRDLLVMDARKIERATSAVEADALAAVAQSIKTVLKTTRATGLELRRPVNDVAAKVKGIEDEFCGPLEDELKRLERIASDFAAAERRRVAAEQAARQAEVMRLERERLAAEQAAAEQARKAAAAAAAVNTQRQMDSALKAEQKAAVATESARAASEAVQMAIRQPLPQVFKPTGLSSRRDVHYEVADLQSIAKARPDLVKIELNRAAVRAICVPRFAKDSDEVDTTTVPGLRLFWADVTSTRATR